MDVSINIQSYKRSGNVDTLRLFPHATLWVHSFELNEYLKEYPNVNIKELPDDTEGNLPRVKNYILRQSDSDVTVLLDDDISAIGYWQDRKQRFLKEESKIYAFVYKYSILVEELGAKLWGINLNPDKQVYREYSPFSTTSYISSSFSCFLKGNECFYDERFPLKEDYDMLIQQCNKYRLNLRVNRYFYVKKSAENIGGCATYRNVDTELEQIRLLQKKWGSKIVKTEKLNHSKSHSSKKVREFDINPIVVLPIRGI